MKKDKTIPELVERYRELVSARKKLESDAETVQGDVWGDDIASRARTLAEKRAEIELHKTSEALILTKIERMLAAELQAEYQSIPAVEARIASGLVEHHKAYGAALAVALSYANRLACVQGPDIAYAIDRAVKIMGHKEQNGQFDNILQGFADATRPVMPDMAADMAFVHRMKNNVPGSPEAEKVVKKRLRELLPEVKP